MAEIEDMQLEPRIGLEVVGDDDAWDASSGPIKPGARWMAQRA